ncbi:hypothetical protein [Mycolicibacterium vanbaalenii]|uniref:hypothetical protein n=1 Tax=Mycolicibacterium vanbaalenii TaxID=110539 RepID=UPI0013304507|nr:hypothetical protein [Mycolicibacterium vanbaalenii]
MTAATDRATGTQLQAAELTLDDTDHVQGCHQLLGTSGVGVRETIPGTRCKAGSHADRMKYVRLQSG